ncbi:glycoside hydrolase family 28 protein [Opitutaceae bacterium TAV4]|nr:glycoside hydrolase family 28 protein [Opitutaceae bacterium TAV4]RRJ99417.1 glycoside hydrolase family 28 protein [Opitutaceae bacterium TAV3]
MTSLPFAALPPLQIPPAATNLLEHGAKEGGIQSCTTAFANAIDTLAAQGGGTLTVPAGRWLTGPICLRSHIRLHLETGAHVVFSREHADYQPPVLAHRAGCWVMNFHPLLYARDATHIAITGRGTFDGQGDAWWEWKKNEDGVRRLIDMVARRVPIAERIFGTVADCVRPNMLEFINCRDVLIENVTLRDSPAYLVHPVGCENVTLRGLSILGNGPNNDGIDPEYCRNVLIEDCLVDTGDDCICLKSGRDQDGWAENRPTENVIVRRIRTRRGHGGIVLGSELSSGIRNVLVEDCDFSGTERGIRIKSAPGRGGFVENIHMRNIRMSDIIDEAIIIHMDYGSVAKGQVGSAFQSNTPSPTRMRNILIEDVTCASAGKALDITGDAALPPESITLRNLRLHATRPATLTHAAGVTLENVQIT